MFASDILDQILELARIRGRVFCQTRASGSWGLAVPELPRVSLHIVLGGKCQLEVDGKKPIELLQGDLALLPHGRGHALYDRSDSKRLSLDEWRKSRDAQGNLLISRGRAGGEEECRLICGEYDVESLAQHPILRSLPPLIRVPATEMQIHTELRDTLFALAKEMSAAAIGSSSIVSRHLEILFVQILRLWISSASSKELGWLGALNDAPIRRVLALLHEAPKDQWTLDRLAHEAGLSRAVLARRFKARVGSSPLAYLADLRMDGAARLLSTSSMKLSEVAEQVGYSSEFAFNRAFKRRHGVPPGSFRRLK